MVTRMQPAVSNGRVGGVWCFNRTGKTTGGAGDLGGRLEGSRAGEVPASPECKTGLGIQGSSTQKVPLTLTSGQVQGKLEEQAPTAKR